MIKKVLFCLLSLVTLILATFIPMVIAGNGGFSLENRFYISLLLIWILLVIAINGIAIFLSDEGFGKVSFIVYLAFSGAALVASLIMLLTFKEVIYPLHLLKYTAMPIALCMIIYRYIDIGYGHDSWFSSFLIPMAFIAVPYLVFWLFASVTSLMIANIVVYAIALVGAIIAVIKSITEGGLANTMWGLKSSGKPGPRYNSSNSDAYYREPDKEIEPASTYEIKDLLNGLSARDFRGVIEYEIKGVDAISSDGGYNFDITIYIKVDTVYGANLNGINSQYELERSSRSAAEALKRLVVRRLNERGVGYNLSAQDY